jgi:hypothetical protein
MVASIWTIGHECGIAYEHFPDLAAAENNVGRAPEPLRDNATENPVA